MTNPTTQDITALTATPCPGGWLVRFESAHAGLCHQLYVNGRLADWTDWPAQRELGLADAGGRMQIAVVAVEPAQRRQDFSGQVESLGSPAWLYRKKIARSIGLRRGDVIEVLTDHATGQMDSQPVLVVEPWPAWKRRWDEDGDGLAPGLGMGGFGAADFGHDAELLKIALPVDVSGLHLFLFRTRSPDGAVNEAAPFIFVAQVPQAAPESLRAAAYDGLHHTLTLDIS